MSSRILIAGVGNIFLGDDAFGVEVIRQLSARKLPDGVTLRDFGIRGFDLAYALMDAWDLVVLVDAVPRGGTAGTIYVIEHDSRAATASDEDALQPHGMNPLAALEMVRSMGGTPPRIIVVGCEPDETGGQDGVMGLSDKVAAAVHDATRTVLQLVGEANVVEAK